MKAIILSAGQGRRLLPLTENTPKCCMHLEGRAVLDWQLSQIKQCQVDEVVVVTGFESERVETLIEQASQHIQGLNVRTLHNPFYARSDNLATCWIAREEMREPFIIINGDTLFEAEILNRAQSSTREFPITITTDEKDAYDDDDMKIIRDGGRLFRVGKKLDHCFVNGESIGMTVFDQQGADLFRDKLETLMKSPEGLSRWYLSAIDELAAEGFVGTRSIAGLSWCEIDDHADLKQAARVVPDWPHPHHPKMAALS
jgi:choline kinase